MVGTGLAASKGILLKGADIFEKIIKINTIVFDKTGTLTSGKPHVKDIISCADHFKLEGAIKDQTRLLSLLFQAELNSEHPLAVAIRESILKKLNNVAPHTTGDSRIIDFKNIDGEGIEVQVEEKGPAGNYTKADVLCGNMKMMRRYNVFPRALNLDESCQYSELIKNINLLEQ